MLFRRNNSLNDDDNSFDCRTKHVNVLGRNMRILANAYGFCNVM